MNQHLIKEVQQLRQELDQLRKEHDKVLLEVQNTPVNHPIVDRLNSIEETLRSHATHINNIYARLQ